MGRFLTSGSIDLATARALIDEEAKNIWTRSSTPYGS